MLETNFLTILGFWKLKKTLYESRRRHKFTESIAIGQDFRFHRVTFISKSGRKTYYRRDEIERRKREREREAEKARRSCSVEAGLSVDEERPPAEPREFNRRTFQKRQFSLRISDDVRAKVPWATRPVEWRNVVGRRGWPDIEAEMPWNL